MPSKPTRTASKLLDSVSPKPPRSTQRERLLRAMIELSAARGLQAVSVAQACARASVSTATFYEYFQTKEECLVCAYRDASAHVLEQAHPLTASGPRTEGEWAEAALAELQSVLGALESDPCAGQLV